VTDWPVARRDIASISRTFWRHVANVTPVSCRKVRVKVRRHMPAATAQSSSTSFCAGSLRIAWQMRTSCACFGIGTCSGAVRAVRISSTISAITRPSRESTSYSTGMRVASTISSRSSVDTSIVMQDAGRLVTTESSRYSVRSDT